MFFDKKKTLHVKCKVIIFSRICFLLICHRQRSLISCPLKILSRCSLGARRTALYFHIIINFASSATGSARCVIANFIYPVQGKNFYRVQGHIFGYFFCYPDYFFLLIFFKFSRIFLSVFSSSADVASSRTRISKGFKNARAILILCA